MLLGLIGRIAEMLFVTRHIRKLLVVRNELIKSVAESSQVDKYLVGRYR